MKNNPLESFGQLLISSVRDEAIEDISKMCNGEARGNSAMRMREITQTPISADTLRRVLVPYIIDLTLYHLLNAIQENECQVLFASHEGTIPVDLKAISDGLPGELYGEGWIRQFSKYPESSLS